MPSTFFFFSLPTYSNCGSSFNYPNIFEERGEDIRQEGKRKRGKEEPEEMGGDPAVFHVSVSVRGAEITT